MKKSPNDGGCWFCHDDSGDMYFSDEFDCWFHMNCLKEALEKDPNNPEAQIIANEITNFLKGDLKYQCCVCGKPTKNMFLLSSFMETDFVSLFGEKEISYCDECARVTDEKAKFENEQLMMDNITCPTCGYVNIDSGLYYDEDGEIIDCESCGSLMELKIEHFTKYTTKRVKLK